MRRDLPLAGLPGRELAAQAAHELPLHAQELPVGDIEEVATSAGRIQHPERAQFIETIVNLRRGEAFVLYTDGLFGAANGEKPWLTPEHLAKMIDPSAPSAEALLMSMMNQAMPADSEHSLPDDVAALAVHRMA